MIRHGWDFGSPGIDFYVDMIETFRLGIQTVMF
jgi:hypothetical protein